MDSTDTVSKVSLVQITGAGTYIVVVSQTGNTDYAGSVAAPEKEHTVSINQATTATVTSGAVPFIYPARRSRLARLASPGPGRLNRSLIESYQNNTNAGSAMSSACYDRSTNYPGSSDRKYFTIDKATLQFTWSNPQAIDYRTALSSTQLSAEANLLGRFAYDSLAGTVLLSGTRG
jgi:hypothetical protein